MATRQRPGDIATSNARRIAREVGREVHDARVSYGLSRAAAARGAGISPSQYGRIERGEIRPTVEQLARAAKAVGMDLSLKLYPGGSPVRDGAHLALLARFEAMLAPPLRLRREVALPVAGDLRAWDGLIEGVGSSAFTEAESHLGDLQAMDRRIALKVRDDPRAQVVILVVSDTAHNRRVLSIHREALRASFPLDGAAIARELRHGRVPRASGIILR